MNTQLINFSSTDLSSSFERIDQFVMLTEAFCEAAAMSNINVKAFRGYTPTYFTLLPADLQIQTLKTFSVYSEVATEMIAANESLASEHRFLWRMIQKLKLHPTKDLFSILEKDDIIEIYSVPDFIQIFRNMSFFSRCSYTLDEILCRPYWELFKREESVTAAIMRTAGGLAASKNPMTIAYDVPSHILEEIDSQSRFRCIVENKYLSPLFNAEKQVMAVVNIMAGQVCDILSSSVATVTYPTDLGRITT